MKEMSEKLVNFNMYRVEDNAFPKTKTIVSQKPHRTVVKGLKLLTEMLKTVEPNNNFTNFPLLDHDHELPRDLFTFEILVRLPIKTLLQLMSVSKEWYSTVTSYEFANVHFKNRLSNYHPSSPVECLFIQVGCKFYLFHFQDDLVALDYCLVKLEPNFEGLSTNDVHLVGSCNGLVCVADSSPSADHFYIWNPISYNSRKFSDSCVISCQNSNVSWGFAYVSSVNDYKVLKIVQDYETLETVVLVFSFRSQEWRRVLDHGLDQSLSLPKTRPGLLVNETLYWTMEARGPSMKRVVVGFNLALEKFEEVPGLIPREVTVSDHFLCVTGGCLSLYSLNVRHEAYLSILKRPKEVETISISSYSGKPSCNSGLVGFTRTGKCFVVSKASELVLVDLNSSEKQCSPLVNFEQGHRPSMLSYVPSLISPFGITDSQQD